MPQVQVINRVEDPTVKALGQAGNDIADTLYKQQSLKLTGEYYKILGKNADTETKKFDLDRKAKTMEMLGRIAETQDQATKSMLVKAMIEGNYQGDAATAFHDIADSHKDIQAQYMAMKPEAGSATEGQVRGAQASNYAAEARGHNANADLVAAVQGRVAGGGQGSQGDFPPGTTINAGGLNMPLNQRLTDTEQSNVAGFEKFEPITKNIEQLIRDGALGKGIGRTANQVLVDQGGSATARLLTPDNTPLEKLASAVTELKKYAFSEGGKQLSPTEKDIVFAGLSLTGKSDAQAIHDFNEAIAILRKKTGLSLGGSNAARVNTMGKGRLAEPPKDDFSTMSTEELRKIAGGG